MELMHNQSLLRKTLIGNNDFKVKADFKKDMYLKDIGLRLIRIKDEDVIDNISIVKQILERFIDDFESSTDTE
jgi:very-short-patch-repair endonuclease